MSTSTSTFPFFFSSTFSRPRSSPLDGRRDLRRLEASGFSASELRFEGSEALRQRFRRDGGEGEGEGERGGVDDDDGGGRGRRKQITFDFFFFFFFLLHSESARLSPFSPEPLCLSFSMGRKGTLHMPSVEGHSSSQRAPRRREWFPSEWTRVVRRPPHAAAPQRPFLVVPMFDAEPSRASSPRRFLSRRIAVKRKAGLSSTSALRA